jgi:hypothetical protein
MRIVGVFVLCSIAFVKLGNAAVAVFQPQNGLGDISVQGFNGPMALPVVQEVPNYGYGIPLGGTASNTALYGLYNPSTPTANSTISINDAQSGAYDGSIALNGRVNDIAYTNGQLYGLQVNSASIQIVSISNTGTITPLVTQTGTTSAGVTWRLGGAVNGSSLLTTALPTIGAPTSAYIIDPASSQVSPFIFSPAPATEITSETIINVAGNAVTLNDLGQQVQYDYPSGANGVQIPTSAQYPFGVVSDEFTYNYAPTNPAYVNLGYNTSIPYGYDNLLRTPPNFTIQTTIYNGAAPDGTTIGNVAVASGQQLWTQQSGPSALQIIQTASAPGSFSNRVVANDTISLSAGAQRGIYSYAFTPNALTGDYTYGTTTDYARVVSTTPSGSVQFAYDPVSSNLVGNGDFILGTAGWEANSHWSQGNTTYSNQSVELYNGEMALVPSSSSAYAARQLLQLPTSGSPMLLSFDYNAAVDRSPASVYNVDLKMYLNSTLVGELVTDSTTIQNYQTVIDDPSLQNLSGAYLTFVASGTGANAVELGNISLTAVPEPATLGLLLVGLALAQRRRRACRC